jgi:hypothetical protein
MSWFKRSPRKHEPVKSLAPPPPRSSPASDRIQQELKESVRSVSGKLKKK